MAGDELRQLPGSDMIGRRRVSSSLVPPPTGGKDVGCLRLRSLFLFTFLVPLLSGCSTSKLAVGAMVPVLENTTTVALRSDDPELIEDAIPTSLLLIEGMLETDPKNGEIARLGSMLSFAYSFAFLEFEDPARASSIYTKGRELGWRALRQPKIENAIRNGSFEELRAALPQLRSKDAPAMLWIAANWAAWTQLNLDDPTAAADFARLLPFVERLVALDELSFWGMPRILLGAVHAGRPVALGGDLKRARAEFDRAYEISDRNLLLAQVYEARTFCTQSFDADCYRKTLQEVLDHGTDSLPDAQLLNQIARRDAARLIELTDDIFE